MTLLTGAVKCVKFMVFGQLEKVMCMNHEIAHEDFGFLTPDRIRAIQQGLISGNGDHDDILDGRQHLHERLNNYHKGTGRRPWFLAHIL